MKKLVLTLIYGIASMALGADEYTIQTISALKEESITPAFEKKVKKSALPSQKIKEGTCNIVTVGHYSDPKRARSDLKKAKAIASDAFVRPVTRVTPKGCESVSVQGKAGAVVSLDTNKSTVPDASKVIGTAAEPSKETAMAANCPPVQLKSEKEEGSAVQHTQTTVLLYDRNLARKSDIHEAIDYYKNSPYHSFRPIGLAR